MSEKTSTTESYQSIGGIITGKDDMYKTTISDGEKYSTGVGSTPEQSQESASNSWDSGDTTDSVCYLTTACTKTMNRPDNCLELEVLRDFRDNFLMKSSEGKRAVKEYYEVAPKIVQAVEKREDASEIWKEVYGDIVHAMSLVLFGSFDKAFEHYKQMTLGLKENYLNL